MTVGIEKTVICHKIDSDIMLHLLDIVEEAIVNQIQTLPAKPM